MAVNNEYVNRVDANGQTLIDLTSDTAEAADVLEGRTLHLASGAPVVGTYRPSAEIEARLEATVGHSSKNLLPITLESRPYDTDGNDFSVTVDKVAGTITINGTSKSSGATNIEFYTDTNGKLSGNFYITGGVTGCVVRAYDYDSQDANKWAKKWDGTNTATGSSSEHDSQEVQAVAGHKFGYRLRVSAGQSFTNAVIKPMLRDGSIADDTFEPYVTPTDEKKQDKPVLLWEGSINPTQVATLPVTDVREDYDKLILRFGADTTYIFEVSIDTNFNNSFPSYERTFSAVVNQTLLGMYVRYGSANMVTFNYLVLVGPDITTNTIRLHEIYGIPK